MLIYSVMRVAPAKSKLSRPCRNTSSRKLIALAPWLQDLATQMELDEGCPHFLIIAP
jgi:hypothetical protein